ncbi:uncharacterized protein [Haliotis asinina]|uniref:uncharacterized protein n=1 Tax=Haliotis asinina TaxID=109174 RepID=UPI003531842C
MKSFLLITMSVLVLHVTAGDMSCNVGGDCPKEMCCKGNPGSQGQCAPLKTEGEDCQMYSGVPSWGQTPWMVRECNCHDGLYCGSDNPQPPLGSRGTCRHWNGLP